MYKSSLERLKEISQKISAIFEICGDDIDASLSDETIIQPAIMMHFISIYELFRGIQEQNDIEALSLFSKEETQTLYRIRNIALYEYEKIDFSMIKIAIESHLPKIRQNILMLN